MNKETLFLIKGEGLFPSLITYSGFIISGRKIIKCLHLCVSIYPWKVYATTTSLRE